jgi:tritrans,polycis-undecaprenyl-diphosphate synthase [geranylgeranyl-diphosphate specific]
MVELPRLVSDTAYATYEAQLAKEVKSGEIPKHIAIIMDGNRRYAREVLNAAPSEGHKLGRDKLEEVVHWCMDLGVRNLTVYAFSTENFKRDPEEVEYILDLLKVTLYKFAEDKDVHSRRLSIKVIGDRDLLPDYLLEAVEYAESRTKDYDDYHLNIAVAYGGRQEIARAVREIAEGVKSGSIAIEDIDEELISDHIGAISVTDPDLILRTSGEIRISNFLLWQMAYSELYFTDVFWPGFRYIDLLRAIRTYQQRKRRYGA